MSRFLLFLVFAWGLLQDPAALAQLVVTTAVDEDDGDAMPGNGAGTSLREAIRHARPGDTVTFDAGLAGRTISVTNGQIAITRSVTVDASALPGGVILDAHGRNSLFHGGSQTTNTLVGLTLTGGRTAQWGGAILNNSVLTLNDCTLVGNVATEGGAIFQFRPTTLNNCTVVSNYARCGGAIYNDGETLTLNHSTIAFNMATNDGGGIFSFFATTLNHCTIVSNRAFYGGGINDEGFLSLTNCIVAGNSAGLSSVHQVAGPIDWSGGINLIAGNPMLAPLGDHGGRTQTMPPLPGSPAIDPVGGDALSVFATDQRGLPRVVNGIVDVGAVEVQPASATPFDITRVARLGDGTIRFTFSNLTGADFDVLASSNVTLSSSNWPRIGPAIETPPGSGHFQFTDPDATNLNRRFYRVRLP